MVKILITIASWRITVFPIARLLIISYVVSAHNIPLFRQNFGESQNPKISINCPVPKNPVSYFDTKNSFRFIDMSIAHLIYSQSIISNNRVLFLKLSARHVITACTGTYVIMEVPT